MEERTTRTESSGRGRLRFGPEWTERVRLADGTRVRLRFVRPEDKGLLADGFGRLSERSRFMRFHGAKTALSERDLRYFTEIDGLDHVALGAVVESEGREEGVGIARCIRLKEDPEMAEAAITVVDSFQGRGIGRLLLDRLAQAALERGVRRFRCEVLVDNAPMRALLREISPEAREHPDGGNVTVIVPLERPGSRRSGRGPAEQLLGLAARRLLRVLGV